MFYLPPWYSLKSRTVLFSTEKTPEQIKKNYSVVVEYSSLNNKIYLQVETHMV